jgi:aminoglycoside phosphotransferase (APT) family kinase protein
VTLDPAVLAWAVAAIGGGGQLLSVDELPDSSTEQHVLTLGTRGGVLRALTRRYHDRHRLEMDFAYAPANEVAALAMLAPTDVPAPMLYAADLEGALTGAPLLLESFLRGEAAWTIVDETYLRAAAEVLVRIHRVAVPSQMPVMAYRPYREPSVGSVPEQGSARPDIWAEVATALEADPPATPAGFIHRDYHPGNVLWDGHDVSIVDWSAAAIGPQGVDLARMRQNLASAHGAAAADRFSALYVEAGGDPDVRHPYWDLLDAADLWSGGDEAPGDSDLPRVEAYVASVLAELG